MHCLAVSVLCCRLQKDQGLTLCTFSGLSNCGVTWVTRGRRCCTWTWTFHTWSPSWALQAPCHWAAWDDSEKGHTRAYHVHDSYECVTCFDLLGHWRRESSFQVATFSLKPCLIMYILKVFSFSSWFPISNPGCIHIGFTKAFSCIRLVFFHLSWPFFLVSGFGLDFEVLLRTAWEECMVFALLPNLLCRRGRRGETGCYFCLLNLNRVLQTATSNKCY